MEAEENCLSHALVIAIARLNNDPNYTSYRKGRKKRPVVRQLREITGVDFKNGGGIHELTRIQEYFQKYKIVVHSGLNLRISCIKVMSSLTSALIPYFTR